MSPGRVVSWTLATIVTLVLTGVIADRAVAQGARIGQAAPEVSGEAWINGGPLTIAGLRGQVVLIEFWTYG
jgi:hypothetical protein